MPTWLVPWLDFLKGLGTAGFFIVFLLIDRAQIRKERDDARTAERKANAALLKAKDDHAAKLLAISERNRQDALDSKDAANVTAESIQSMADALVLIAESSPDTRRAA
ncbi:hypothetical protein sos41_12000 [Alphaproteobacteria bacterium SO-S41]|nr:hypothetical protein sos41_12000 [Alphaproteobacteria bacterium SO-S41]